MPTRRGSRGRGWRGCWASSGRRRSDRRLGTFSLGCASGSASPGALLGDPGAAAWTSRSTGSIRRDPLVRELPKGLAAQGRTVFVSSHLMNEMELTSDRVVVIGRGKLIDSLDVASCVCGPRRYASHLPMPMPRPGFRRSCARPEQRSTRTPRRSACPPTHRPPGARTRYRAARARGSSHGLEESLLQPRPTSGGASSRPPRPEPRYERSGPSSTPSAPCRGWP